jgi:hypothetical protein
MHHNNKWQKPLPTIKIYAIEMAQKKINKREFWVSPHLKNG